MEQINIRVGDLVKVEGIPTPCLVKEIKTDGVIAITEFGKEYITCDRIWGCISSEKDN